MPDWLEQPFTYQKARQFAQRIIDEEPPVETDREELPPDAKLTLLQLAKQTDLESLLTEMDQVVELSDWVQQSFTYQKARQFAQRIVDVELSDEASQRELMPDAQRALLQVSKYVGGEESLIEAMGLPTALQRPIPRQAVPFVKRVIEDCLKHNGREATKKLVRRMVQVAEIKEDKQDDPSANLCKYYAAYLDFVLKWNKNETAEQIRRLLKALAVAYGPLPKDMVARLVNLAPDQRIEGLVNQVSGFVEWADSLKTGVVCEHPSIKNFLADRFPADEAHGMFLETARKEIEPGAWKDVADWSEQFKDSYEQRYLSDHAYECYQTTEPQNEKACRTRANEFLGLVCAPGFRSFCLSEVGARTALRDIRRGLRVAFAEYALPADVEAPQALEAFEHVLVVMGTADDSALLGLERRLRRENGGVPALLEFLGLPMDLLVHV